MSAAGVPQDLVAIFHASFHPTKGNTIDWSVTASEDINLDNVEFSALPSGLHLVEQDVVYFTKDNHHGVCIFRRRRTDEANVRGAHLSSLGILLAKSSRPKPWRHVPALKELVERILSRLDGASSSSSDHWDLARTFFQERKVQSPDLGGAGDWRGWSYELDGDAPAETSNMSDPHFNPTLHLPHLLRIMGPSSLTLYKYVLGRKRVLIYTHPPVEAACILCHVAGDMCYEDQVDSPITPGGTRLKGRCKEGINVLGMVTLMDVDRMESEGKTGRGWVACTTDAIFLERPTHYDLLIDLTTSTPNKASRPSFYASSPISPKPSAGHTHKLSTVRFAWSDVKLWTELDRLLQRDKSCCSGDHDSANIKAKIVTVWTDVWSVYEDVCIVCASIWMGWRGTYPSGDIRLEGSDDLSLNGIHVRSLGQGIEGRPPGEVTSKAMKRSSGMSVSIRCGEDEDGYEERPGERQLLTTLALLQTFHAHTLFQLSILESLLPSGRRSDVVVFGPKDVLAFELGPLSTVDTRYLEWLAEEYGDGTKVIVRKRWKEVLGVVLGYG